MYCGEGVFLLETGQLHDIDDGVTFALESAVPPTEQTCVGTTFLFASGDTLYRSTRGAPYAPLPPLEVGEYGNVMASADGRLYATVIPDASPSAVTIQVSDDAGDTWTSFGLPPGVDPGPTPTLLQSVEGYVAYSASNPVARNTVSGRMSLDARETALDLDFFRDLPRVEAVHDGASFAHEGGVDLSSEQDRHALHAGWITRRDPRVLEKDAWDVVLATGVPHPLPSLLAPEGALAVDADGHLIGLRDREVLRTRSPWWVDERADVLQGRGCDVLERPIGDAPEAPGPLTLTHSGELSVYVAQVDRATLRWFEHPELAGQPIGTLDPGETWSIDADVGPVVVFDAAGRCLGRLTDDTDVGKL
jgi:hypothetical protein